MDLLLPARSYIFQIHFDFSGYSDMAVGMALMLGLPFTKNFNDPYRAVSITDFWRRWHIALSTWLRDYLYLSLGGNRLGELRTYINLMIIMLVGGRWHGASWNFVVWCGIHGGILTKSTGASLICPWSSGKPAASGPRHWCTARARTLSLPTTHPRSAFSQAYAWQELLPRIFGNC
jgi:D-alanyl-lipoteichoic acid acyltransferase DltB (MBOAT superfamily)